MCESAAYVIREGGEEKLLDDVTLVKPDEGRVFLRNLFGKEVSIKGRIDEIRFMEHKIILVEDE